MIDPYAPRAWMRRWAYDGETPKKERKENGRMAWPLRFKLMAVTAHKVLPDDVPLFAILTEKKETKA